jgi:magnesium chelatase family protein
MVARLVTWAFDGAGARWVDVQVQIADAGANPYFSIAGLADKAAAREAGVRTAQSERYKSDGLAIATSAIASGAVLDRVAKPDGPGRDLLGRAADTLRLTARAYHRTLKVSRTIADIDGVDGVKRIHIAEA